MSTIVSFGKYKGKTVEEVKTTDINWLIWVSKSYDVNSFSSPNPYARLKKSTIIARESFLSEVKRTVDEHFNSLAEQNRKTSESNHVGKIRERFQKTLTVLGVYKKIDYAIIKTETADKNLIYFYDKDFGLTQGQEIEVKGTVYKHTENVGVKVTYLNRVILLSVPT